MNYKPLIIILGEPFSIFLEIFFKTYKKIIKNQIKRPIILIGDVSLLKKQMCFFNYKFKIYEINCNEINKIRNNNFINIIDVKFNSNKTFDKISKRSSDYIQKCFDKSFYILKKYKVAGLINGPISKKNFLKGKYLGVTELLAAMTKTKNCAMLIYNSKLSVCPVTTHLSIKDVSKNLSKKLIIDKVNIINKFYKKKLKINPKIAILGLNPHCETSKNSSEESKIIIPAIKSLKKNKIKISGPYPADTFFLKKNIKMFNIVFGMYHDQVLTPIKTLYEFDAINITVGLPFVRISPDHGPNEKMLSKGKSNPLSLIQSIKFFEEK